jgi:2-polyprenyl-3-methyl-5-hydroxy-6-metoxy-1,4-benzoquinol methylase
VELVDRLAPTGELCELGCGNGYLAGMLGRDGRRVVGVDASGAGFRIAREHYGENAEFLCETVGEQLVSKLGAERFSVVISSEVIEQL